MFDWGIDRGSFEDAVHALCVRQFGGEADVRVMDGRGGDGGRDITFEKGERLTVLQLKFFPEGFGGRFAKRRTQISKSFAAATAHSPGMTDWILVVPAQLTPGDWKFIDSLKTDRGPAVQVWDRPTLDSMLSAYPDLQAYLERTDLLFERAKVFQQEKAILAGGATDLADRSAALHALGAELDPNWGFEHASGSNGTTIRIVPKHALAHEVSPIQLHVQFAFPADHPLLSQTQDAFRFGVVDPLVLGQEVVASVRFDGPPALGFNDEKTGTLRLEPNSTATAGQAVQLTLMNADGATVSTHSGLVAQTALGVAGGTIRTVFYGCLTATFKFPKDTSRCPPSGSTSKSSVLKSATRARRHDSCSSWVTPMPLFCASGTTRAPCSWSDTNSTRGLWTGL